jgi:membrane dipeptidase
MSENTALLPSNTNPSPSGVERPKRSSGTILVVLALIGACIFVGIRGEKGLLPKNPMKRAQYILSNSPVIDGHVDLPELARTMYSNNVDSFDLNKATVSLRDADMVSLARRPDTPKTTARSATSTYRE